MATKSAAVGSKRKVAPSGKGKFDNKVKKVRLDETKSRRAPVEEPEDESDSLSDSEDGGVSLEDQQSKRGSNNANGASNGKSFERGKSAF